MTNKFGLALFILALTGCAAKSVTSDFSFDNNPQVGLAVFSVTSDKGSAVARGNAIFYMNGSSLNKNHQMLSSYEDIGPAIRKVGKDFKDTDGRLFVINLSEGEHALTSWQIATGSVRIHPKQEPNPLTFQIKAGEVKYLGNFHANFRTGKNIFGMTVVGSGYPEIRDESKRDIALFEERYPQFKNKIRGELLTLGPWLKSLETTTETSVPPPALTTPHGR